MTAQANPTARPLAVIDIGTTSLRMIVAQVDEHGAVKPMDFLTQAVSLGKDTFTKGYIEKQNIEECVRVIKSFRRVLDEYGIRDDDQIRALATTAVGEATNREAFVDRVYMATGIAIEPLDEVDVTRLTYLGVRQFLLEEKSLAESPVLVTEVGGGSTQVLLVHTGNVAASQSYRLGSLRLREMMEVFRAPVVHQRDFMENQIRRTVEQVLPVIPVRKGLQLVAMGSDARFAATQIVSDWNHATGAKVPLAALAELTEMVLGLSVDDLVKKYHLSYPDAETVGPALLFYLRLCRGLKLRSLTVTDFSMRHGALVEMARSGAWTESIRGQVVLSAFEIARKYSAEEMHIQHVASLCKALFAALKEEHQLSPWHELLLTVAALLHDIGLFISNRSHHKHSMYLIQNSDIFGLNKKDTLIAALVARYHRRTAPKPIHEEYHTLDQEERLAVSKLAAILRVADALDRSGQQRVRDITCSREDGAFVITASQVEDLSVEQVALRGKGSMFEDVYGMNVVLRRAAPATE